MEVLRGDPGQQFLEGVFPGMRPEKQSPIHDRDVQFRPFLQVQVFGVDARDADCQAVAPLADLRAHASPLVSLLYILRGKSSSSRPAPAAGYFPRYLASRSLVWGACRAALPNPGVAPAASACAWAS